MKNKRDIKSLLLKLAESGSKASDDRLQLGTYKQGRYVLTPAKPLLKMYESSYIEFDEDMQLENARFIIEAFNNRDLFNLAVEEIELLEDKIQTMESVMSDVGQNIVEKSFLLAEESKEKDAEIENLNKRIAELEEQEKQRALHMDVYRTIRVDNSGNVRVNDPEHKRKSGPPPKPPVKKVSN